ncbi:MAG: hypothetical protein C0412_14800, partial [Flavobacterium sp.]|nr:hypothetical protein [Flavobacterium sp.]
MILLILYFISSWYVGHIIVSRWINKQPTLFLLVSAYLIGTLISVPIVYIFSYIIASVVEEPLSLGILGAVLLNTYISIRYRKPVQISFVMSDVIFFVASLIFSSWLMFKTFHGDMFGQLFVGSNNVFDFGFSLGLMRSISWGSNIPFGSPFYAGFPLFYHFFFNFYTAIWEYLGVSAVWAINGPSILSFSALLTIIYFFPLVLFKQKRIVGWISSLLVITHPTLA